MYILNRCNVYSTYIHTVTRLPASKYLTRISYEFIYPYSWLKPRPYTRGGGRQTWTPDPTMVFFLKKKEILRNNGFLEIA